MFALLPPLTASWEDWRPADDVVVHLRETLCSLGGDPEETSAGRFEGTFGSRIMYRLLGPMLRSGVSRFPWKYSITVEPQAPVNVTLTGIDNEGPFLLRISAAQRAFASRFDDTVAALQRGTADPTSKQS